MRLVDAVSRLSAIQPAARPASRVAGVVPSPGFSKVAAFGSNPGGLAMNLYTPAALRPAAPLVVVLHGCGQHAREFASDSGWVAMADRLGFPLVLPEQRLENNHGRCFNWFRPSDTKRGSGEMLSIRQMVAVAKRSFTGGKRRTFVVGLSAGGSMAAACLAAYPEMFAAGAVIAGLPVGAASNLPSAMGRMAHAGSDLGPAQWALAARASAPGHTGRYPRLSVWHGGADRSVDPANAENLVAQWRGLSDLDAVPSLDETRPGGTRHRAWGTPARRAIEWWTVPGMAHGYPIEAGSRSDRFVIAAGIDATEEIARFWGLLPTASDHTR